MPKITISAIEKSEQDYQILVEGEQVETEFLFQALLALINALTEARGISKMKLIRFLIANMNEIIIAPSEESGEPVNEVEESID